MPTLYAEPLGGDRFKVLLPGDIPPADVPGDFLYPLLAGKDSVANTYVVTRQQLPLLVDSMGVDRVEPFSGLLSFLNDGETREQTKELMRAGGQLSGEAAGFLAEMVPAMLSRTPTGQAVGVVGRAALSTAGRKARQKHQEQQDRAYERGYERDKAFDRADKMLSTHKRRTAHIKPKSEQGHKKMAEAAAVRKQQRQVERELYDQAGADILRNTKQRAADAARKQAEDIQGVIGTSQTVMPILRQGAMMDHSLKPQPN